MSKYFMQIYKGQKVLPGDVYCDGDRLESFQNSEYVGQSNDLIAFRPIREIEIPQARLVDLARKLVKANKIIKFLKMNMQDISDFSHDEGGWAKHAERQIESKLNIIKISVKDIIRQLEEIEAE